MDRSDFRYEGPDSGQQVPLGPSGFPEVGDSDSAALVSFAPTTKSGKQSGSLNTAPRRGVHRKSASDTFAFAAGAAFEHIPADVLHLMNQKHGDLLDEELSRLPPDAFSLLDLPDFDMPDLADDSAFYVPSAAAMAGRASSEKETSGGRRGRPKDSRLARNNSLPKPSLSSGVNAQV